MQSDMKKLFYALTMCCTLLLLACGGKKTQGESADVNKPQPSSLSREPFWDYEPEKHKTVAVKTFVEKFYLLWSEEDVLDYDYVKQHITPNLLKYLADAYEFDCEGECLATWKFLYEDGGDFGGLKSRKITARDESHVLVENNYGNYEYDVLLKLIKVGDTYKIDSLEQVKSEYIN